MPSTQSGSRATSRPCTLRRVTALALTLGIAAAIGAGSADAAKPVYPVNLLPVHPPHEISHAPKRPKVACVARTTASVASTPRAKRLHGGFPLSSVEASPPAQLTSAGGVRCLQ